MIRIEADDIRARLADPATVVRLLGLAEGARRTGSGWLVRCPAHADNGPSCSIRTASDGTIGVRCFGCNLAGDVLHLVAAAERLDIEHDFPAVLRRAAQLAGLDPDGPPDQRPPPPPRPRAPAGPPPLPDERFAAVVAPIFHVGRLDAGSAIARDVVGYLDGRGLLEAARADGWAALPPAECQGSWCRMMHDAAEPAEGYEPPFTLAELDCAGIVGRDAFVHEAARLVIPWRDEEGRVVNVQRRRLDRGEPKYVACRGRGFPMPYGIERISEVPPDAPLVFVEGAVDTLALRLLLAARRETALVLGIPGVSGWRASWAQLARGRVAGVGLDPDAAGEARVRDIANDLAAAGAVRLERWTPPGGAHDWADAWASTTSTTQEAA